MSATVVECWIIKKHAVENLPIEDDDYSNVNVP